MWHLKTNVGTFWIVAAEKPGAYILGVEDVDLGTYSAPECAVQDVQQHSTGCLGWDEQLHGKAAPDLGAWHPGLPRAWES